MAADYQQIVNDCNKIEKPVKSGLREFLSTASGQNFLHGKRTDVCCDLCTHGYTCKCDCHF